MMSTVTYSVFIHATINIDAEDLIENSAREIIENSVDDISTGEVAIHDIEIEVE
jgi:hypothetical protein